MTDYATLAEFKVTVPLASTDASRDASITRMLTAASRAIDAFCGRPDGFVALGTAAARVYPGSGESVQRIDECTSITTVSVKDSPTDATYTDWAATDWVAFSGDPEAPNFNSTPYTQLMISADSNYSVFTGGTYGARGGVPASPDRLRAVPTVQVTAKWGYATTVPAQIKEVCILQAARWWKRGQSAWADTLGSSDLGQLMYTKVLDPDLQMILQQGRFVRPGIG